jgi:hypothetical protein
VQSEQSKLALRDRNIKFQAMKKVSVCSLAMGNGHLAYDPWIWLKVKSMASTASNRKIPKDQQNSGF